MKKYNFILVGLGRQTQKQHLPDLLACPSAKIVALVDVDKKILRQTTANLNVPGYSRLDDALKSASIDAAIVSLPHNQYFPVLETLIKHKIPVLKEKPLAVNFSEAEKICRLSSASKIPVAINVQRRLINHYQETQKFLKSIGEIFFVKGHLSLFVEDPSAGWRGKKSIAGGGCVIDMGYHLIDLLIWYVGLPDDVLAQTSSKAKPGKIYDTEDTALILFKNSRTGIYGELTISRFLGPKHEELQFIGSNGIVRLTRNEVTLFTNAGVPLSRYRLNHKSKATSNPVKYFIRILNGTSPNIVSPQKQLANMAFIEACYHSGKTEKFVNPLTFMKHIYE